VDWIGCGSKCLQLWWIGLDWIGSVIWWIGLDWILKTGPTDISGLAVYSRRTLYSTEILTKILDRVLCYAKISALMLSPRGQSGLEAKILASASASKLWPRRGLDLVVLLCNRAFFVQKSCKIREFC